MAKKSSVEKNNRRKRTVIKYAKQREELKSIISNMKFSNADRLEARRKLALLPRDANPGRVRNRCALTGRPRGYIRFFGLSRIAMRELGLLGELPGLRKSNH